MTEYEKNQLLRFTLHAIIIYLTYSALNPAIAASQLSVGNGTHVCGVIDGSPRFHRDSKQQDNRHYARIFAANLNVGEPRTVRMIYFTPNDRPYRAEVVQLMKYEILSIQTFFAEQMEAHGYGKLTFRVETDPQGEPIVHRVDGQYADSRYFNNTDLIYDEIERTFDLNANIYLIIIDNSGEAITEQATGIGFPRGKQGGFVLVNEEFSRDLPANLATHELGHGFGLDHDFRDGAYIMSYGPGWSQLSACHAEKLSVHPYFNSDTPIEQGEPPTIELISSPIYPVGSQSVSIQLKANDSDELHQVLLSGSDGLIACRGLAGKKNALIEFDYDGVFTSEGFTNLSDSVAHPIRVEVVDTDGDVGGAYFSLVELSPHYITTFEGHTGDVGSVAFSPIDATLLATASSNEVKLWDVTTQREIATLNGGVPMAFSSDGKILATRSRRGGIKLWDVSTHQEIATLKVHAPSMSSMAFSPDKRTLAADAGGGTVKLWDVETDREIATFIHAIPPSDNYWLDTVVSFSADGTTLATGSGDGTVKLWDVTTKQRIATLPHTDVTSVAFSPVDATLLATGSWDRIVIWEVEMQQEIATLEGHRSRISSVAFSSDGSTLAAGLYSKRTVKLWDITTRVNFATLSYGTGVYSVAFSSDDTTLACGAGEGTIQLWDMSGLMAVRLETTAEINIPDPNLRAAVAEEIGLSPNTPIFRGHLGGLTRLEARNANIGNLTGLESATNLRSLDLGGEYVEAEERVINSNSVSDFSPLTGLTKLRSLYLGGNSISNISAVADLTQLTRLYLWGNNVSDISSVAGLTNLIDLNLGNNSVSNISAISGLTNLRTLDLGGNSISNISAVADLTQLTRLYLWGNNVSDISSVAGLTNLIDLDLGDNSVSNISAVSGLTNLTRLTLWGNSVSDISSVAGLTNLTNLNVGNNSVSNISAVSGLTNLVSLNLGDNSVSDISAVSGLTSLTSLYLWNNSLSDVSAVAGLTQLTQLYLSNNAISDVSPLLGLNLTGTSWNSTGLYLEGNPLSYPSINTHIPAMQAKGIEVKFDNRTPTTLVKISGTEQQGVVNTVLPHPFVVEVRDEWHRAFSGVPVTFTVTAGGGTLSVTRTTTDENGRAQVHLTLGKTAGTATVSVAAAEILQSIRFTATALRLSSPVTVPDAALRTKIAETLGKSPGRSLTVGDMLRLTALTANNANIRELTGLHHAANLATLSLDNNTFSDVSSLGGLLQLTTLSLNNSSLSDLTPITGLTQLITLSLDNNNLSDISTLVELTQLKTLHLRGNPLSYPSLRTHIPAMQANGVVVTVDSRTPTRLLNISGAHGVAGAALPLVVEVQDQHNRAFLGVPVTFTVTVGEGKLSATTATTDITGRARTSLALGRTPGRNTVRVSAPEVSQPVSFTITAIEGSSSVTVPDAGLRAKIKETLGKSEGVQLTAGDMLALTRLDAPNANIQDLTGLEYAYTLRTVNLGGEWVSGEGFVNSNAVSDFSPLLELTQLTTLNLSSISLLDTSALSGLTQLTQLYLSNNAISDISAVAGLANLTDLDVNNNSVSNISAVSGLTNLISLNLGGNSVSDISSVAGLTNLIDLNLGNNSVSNISAISGLTNLRTLDLGGNSVSDISSVSGLTSLTSLYLWNNSLSDVSAVAGLTQLTQLYLSNNAISDVSPLLGLNLTGTSWNSTGLYLEGNPLSYLSINTHIPALQAKGIEVKFDNRTPTTLLNISGVITASDNVLTVEVRDGNGRTFEGAPVTFTVTSGGGTLSVTSITTDEKGRAQSTLTLGKESNRVRVSVVGVEQTLTFSDVAGAGVHIPAPNLRAAIEGELGVKPGNPISPEEMATLTHLRARDASIGVLIGLEFATNLTELRLGDNGITDISPLSGLTNLKRLGLGRNSITDMSPLSGLTNLRTLGLSNNGITDLSALVRVLSDLTNLTELHLQSNRITDISSLSGLPHLTELRLGSNNITDISSLANLTDLTNLHLQSNRITNISSLSGLTHLTELRLRDNRITDISPLSGLTNLRNLELPSGIQDLPTLVRVLSRLTHLTSLSLSDNNIADVSALIPVLTDLTDLRDLNLNDNNITDLSPLAVLTNLTGLHLWNNNISDISAVAGLTNLRNLWLGSNSISDISAVAGLTNLRILDLWGNHISAISPLVENTGLGAEGWGWVGVRENPLSYQSIHEHIPILESRGVTVDFDAQAHPTLLIISGDNQRRLPGEPLTYPFVVEARAENGSPFAGVSVTFVVTVGGGSLSVQTTTTDANGRAQSTLTLGPNFGINTVTVSATLISVSVTFHAIGDTPEYLWSIPGGTSWIHVPLKVTAVDGVAMTIGSIADLYDALGGAASVNHLSTLDPVTQGWHSYLGDSSRGTLADKVLTDDTGIIAVMNYPVSLRLSGDPLGANGRSAITLYPGLNLVGVPLRDSRVHRVSDLLTLDEIEGNVSAIIVSDNGESKTVGRAGDTGDSAITGGHSFILTAQQMAVVAISGDGWYNTSETAAAPLLSLKGVEVGDTTPVLALTGVVISPIDGWGNQMPHLRPGSGLRVIVKNLSTGKAVATVSLSRLDKRQSERGSYQVTFVDVETGRAAQIGDILEISVRSPSPLIGVQPVRYTVTAEDVLRSRIELAELIAYEIPTETELLANYPNPFNPETWIPYRLAEDAFVTLTIYDQTGQVVRTIDVGHQPAAVYEHRSKAIYWDGRNDMGEMVASGVYFYHLSAGDYSATRKMVILK